MFRGPESLASHHNLQDFQTDHPALDDWLVRYALNANSSGSTRVHVITPNEDDRVVGFYALSAASVACDEVPARFKKGQGQYPVPIALITRLAVDNRFQGKGLGARLLRDALLRLLEAADIIGIRAIQAHAKDEKARQFYLHFRFKESPVDPLGVFLLLKDARQNLG